MPVENGLLSHWDSAPFGCVLIQVAIGRVIEGGIIGLSQQGVNFGGRGPEFAQIDGLTVGSRAQRFGIQIDVDAPSQREGDHEWRRTEIVGFAGGVYPAFEIAISRQHGGGD